MIFVASQSASGCVFVCVSVCASVRQQLPSVYRSFPVQRFIKLLRNHIIMIHDFMPPKYHKKREKLCLFLLRAHQTFTAFGYETSLFEKFICYRKPEASRKDRQQQQQSLHKLFRQFCKL